MTLKGREAGPTSLILCRSTPRRKLERLEPRAVLQTPPMTRCTRLVFDETRIITGSLDGWVVALDIQ